MKTINCYVNDVELHVNYPEHTEMVHLGWVTWDGAIKECKKLFKTSASSILSIYITEKATGKLIAVCE